MRQREPVDALELVVRVVRELLVDLGARDVARDTDLHAVLRQVDRVVLLVGSARAARTELAEPARGRLGVLVVRSDELFAERRALREIVCRRDVDAAVLRDDALLARRDVLRRPRRARDLDLAAENLDVHAVGRGGHGELRPENANLSRRRLDERAGSGIDMGHVGDERAVGERDRARGAIERQLGRAIEDDEATVVELDACTRAAVGRQAHARLDLRAVTEVRLARRRRDGEAAGLVGAAARDLRDLAVPCARRCELG